VIGLDNDEKLINNIAQDLSLAATGDATDEQVLRELNLLECDAVLVAIGDHLETSLLCVLALQAIGVEQIWVKATTSPQHTILSRLGVARIIHPEEEMGVRVAQSLNYPMVNQYMSLGSGMYLVELKIEDNYDDVSLQSLLKPACEEITPVLIRRRKNIIKISDLDILLEKDDSLILSGPLEALKKLAPEFD
jgi:trk system potassium uptake protein TrkA